MGVGEQLGNSWGIVGEQLGNSWGIELGIYKGWYVGGMCPPALFVLLKDCNLWTKYNMYSIINGEKRNERSQWTIW